jgi:MFS superfamily sulfate permease-like transporter
LKNLPEVLLAVIVLHAVSGLIKTKELKLIYQLSRIEFLVSMTALSGVLVFGILKGVMLSVIMSLIFLIRRTAHPNVAVLGLVKILVTILILSVIPIISRTMAYSS